MDYTQPPKIWRRAWKPLLVLVGYGFWGLQVGHGSSWIGKALTGLGGVLGGVGQALVDSGALTFLLLLLYLGGGVLIVLYLGADPGEEPLQEALERFRQDPTRNPAPLRRALEAEGAGAAAALAGMITRDLDLDRALLLVRLAPRFDGPPLHARLRELADSPSEAMAVAAVEAWAGCDDPGIEAGLMELLGHPREGLVLAALRGLVRREAHGARAAVRDLLARDPSRSVRDAGREALEVLGG